MRFPSAALIAAALLGFTPGAGAQVLDDLSPAAVRRQVAPGDVVRATVSDGRAFDLRIVKVEAETLTGTTLENRRFRIRYSALASLEIRSKAAAGAKDPGVVALDAPRESGVMTWLGLNIGLVSGDIDLPCPNPGDDCSEGGLFTSFGVNVTAAGPFAARLRAVRANEDTAKPPVEVAALVGPRIADDIYLLVGASTVDNPDDDYPGDAKGVAWELLFAPRSLSGAGIEVALHGAAGSDLRYAGLSFGMRFGTLH